MRPLTKYLAPCLPLLATIPNEAAAQAVGCTLTVEQDGALGASVDGRILGSEEEEGRSAILRIQNTIGNTITIDAPTMIGAPAEYDPSGQDLEVAYRGDGAFTGVVQDYIPSSTAFAAPGLSNDTITIDARALPEAGKPLVSGTYQLRVVVTCS